MARRSRGLLYDDWIFIIFVVLLEIFTTNFFASSNFVLAAVGKPQNDSNEQNIVVSKKDAINYLATYGYITPASKISSLTLDELSTALRIFQRMAGLAVTGKLDYSTLQRMSQPRCGVKDDNLINKAQKITLSTANSTVVPQLRFSTFSRWPKSHLTWHIASFSTHMPKQTQQIELQRAYDLWAHAASLRIEYAAKHQPGSRADSASSADVDLKVLFLRGDHGDNEPFDGPGGALGHAFFPRFGGATHFDDAEMWSANSTSGVNLFQVAAHEFGHALGLGHSDVQDAIMAPFYKPYSADFALHSDDVEAVRQLYADAGSVADELPVTFEPHEQTTATSTAKPELSKTLNADQFVMIGGNGKDITKFWETSTESSSVNQLPLPPALSAPYADDTLNNVEININDIEPTPIAHVKPLRPVTSKFVPVGTADDAVTMIKTNSSRPASNTPAPSTVNNSTTTTISTIASRGLMDGVVSPRTAIGFGTSYGGGAPGASFHDGGGFMPAPSAQHVAGFSPFDGGGFGGGGYGGGGGGYGLGAGGGIYGGGGGGILHGGYDQFAYPFPTYRTTTTAPTTTTTYAPAYPAFNPFFFGHGYGGGGGGYGGGHAHLTTTPRPEHKYVKKPECNFRDIDCIINQAYGQFHEAQATFFNGFYTTTAKPLTTTRAPESVCDFTRIDAISSDEWGGFWVFSGRRFAYLNINFVQLRFGFTTELATQLTEGVTGAYHKNKYLFLFDNNNNKPFNYYKFDATDYKHLVLQDDYPREHGDGYPGLFSRDAKMNAVLERHDLTLLMFQNGRMYKYNPFEQPPVNPDRYPVLLKDISLNFPTALDATLFHLHYGSFVFAPDGVYPVTSYGDLALRYPQRPPIPIEQFFRCGHFGYGIGGHVRSDGNG